MSDDAILVRPARAGDLARLAELWKELVEYHLAIDDFFQSVPDGHLNYLQFLSRYLNEKNGVVMVAEVNGKVIGFCLARLADTPPPMQSRACGEILDAVVAVDYRRQGIGEQLIAAVKQWFTVRDVTRLHVNVMSHNPIGVAFWRKMGFGPFEEKLVWREGD